MRDEKRRDLWKMKTALEKLRDAFDECEEAFESDEFDCNDYITDCKKEKDKYPFQWAFEEMVCEVSDWVWDCINKIDRELN